MKQSIRITTHLASELSAFHLRENMGNTLVIAIAQSGTTIDTNVAVKLVKARGAFTLAILNKRQGDISYLVDTTIYLGNGRDIEIAVPSTKTYICHIGSYDIADSHPRFTPYIGYYTNNEFR